MDYLGLQFNLVKMWENFPSLIYFKNSDPVRHENFSHNIQLLKGFSKQFAWNFKDMEHNLL